MDKPLIVQTIQLALTPVFMLVAIRNIMNILSTRLARIVDRPGQARSSAQVIPQGVVILLDGQLVTVLTPADRDALRNQSMAQLQRQTLARIDAAVAAAEQARLPQRIVQGLAWVLLASVAAFSFLWVLRLLLRRLRHRVDAWVKVRLEQVRFRTLGCYPLTGAIRSSAATLDEVIAEMRASHHSEREGRLIDRDETGSMEKKKREGYF